ncbi:MAG: 2-C-methyl-D-erythritol 4-phosphate cytidylyltransferase [Balneolaceae bacterium]|nr:2-C-methyl-D-erythritol 4-phosphate cytidylyltransferase [Balneolaceae bacterium]
MNSVALIIPAAGSGERLEQQLPKPYIKIAGKTILEHTLRRFLDLRELKQVIVATSDAYREMSAEALAATLPSTVDYCCVEGGAERQHSISHALEQVGEAELVAVHDAVRPFIRAEVIRRCIEAAAQAGGAVVGVRAKDTVKKVDEEMFIDQTPERKSLWQTQTPQIFKKEILREAYRRASEEAFVGTDDSSLVERLGRRVKMVEGDRDNFKITYPVDLKLARLLLEEEDSQ